MTNEQKNSNDLGIILGRIKCPFCEEKEILLKLHCYCNSKTLIHHPYLYHSPSNGHECGEFVIVDELGFEYRNQGCGVLAWTYGEDDDFSPLLEGMSAEEAMEIGLLKPDISVNQDALPSICKAYEADQIVLRGMKKSERQKQREEELEKNRNANGEPLKIRADLGRLRKFVDAGRKNVPTT